MPGFMVAQNVGAGVAATNDNLKPVYQYTWEIVNLFEDNRNLFPGGEAGVKLLAKEATLPTFTISKDTVDGSSLVYKYAGMVTWEDIRITFYDVRVGGNQASGLIKTWRDNVWEAKTGLKSPNDYKKDSKLNVYDLEWTSMVIWVLHGSWPQSIKEGDLTYTATEMKVIDVTICYDWADMEARPYVN